MFALLCSFAALNKHNTTEYIDISEPERNDIQHKLLKVKSFQVLLAFLKRHDVSENRPQDAASTGPFSCFPI